VENLQEFLAKQTFKPLDSSNGRVWIGEVGWHLLLVKFPDADSHVFDSLIRSDHAAWVDLLDATVSPEKGTAAWISAGGLRVMALVPPEQTPSRAEAGGASTQSLMVAAVRQGSAAAAEELVKRSKTRSSEEMIAFRRSLEEIATLTPDTASIHFGAGQLVEAAALVAMLLRATDARRSWHAKKLPKSLQDWFPGDQKKIWETVAARIETWPFNQSMHLLQATDRAGAVFAYGNTTGENREFHVLGVLGGDFGLGTVGEKTWVMVAGAALHRFFANVFPETEKKMRIEDEILGTRYEDLGIGDWSIGILKATRLQLLKVTIEGVKKSSVEIVAPLILVLAVCGLSGWMGIDAWSMGAMIAGVFLTRFNYPVHEEKKEDEGGGTRNSRGSIGEFVKQTPLLDRLSEAIKFHKSSVQNELDRIRTRMQQADPIFELELVPFADLIFTDGQQLYFHLHSFCFSMSWFFPVKLDALKETKISFGKPLIGVSVLGSMIFIDEKEVHWLTGLAEREMQERVREITQALQIRKRAFAATSNFSGWIENVIDEGRATVLYRTRDDRALSDLDKENIRSLLKSVPQAPKKMHAGRPPTKTSA
jgi:hypothetical protein